MHNIFTLVDATESTSSYAATVLAHFQNVQDHPLPPSMGLHPRAHLTRAVVTAGYACSDADIHLKYETAAGPCVPRGRRPWSCARGFRTTFDAEGHTQAQPAFV